MFTSTINMRKKCNQSDFDHRMIVSEPADLLGFSQTSSEQQFCRQKALVMLMREVSGEE